MTKNVRLLERDKLSVRFLVEGINATLLNAIRRATISRVPTMAIDTVVIVENSSIMYDEILAHRLGLIPLTTDLDSLDATSSVVLTLNVKAKKDNQIVYSGDLISTSPDVRPVWDNIPIVVLRKGQSIRLEATARLGKGLEHAKWQPTSVSAYKNLPFIKVNKDLCKGYECEICIKNCPKNVLEMSKGIPKLVDPVNCTLCRYCEKTCPEGAIKVLWYEDKFVYKLESTGAIMPPERIFLEAINILLKDISEFKSKLKELEVS